MRKFGSGIIELGTAMELEKVCELIRAQVDCGFEGYHDHGITLKEALVPPRRIPVVERTIEKGSIGVQETCGGLIHLDSLSLSAA